MTQQIMASSENMLFNQTDKTKSVPSELDKSKAVSIALNRWVKLERLYDNLLILNPKYVSPFIEAIRVDSGSHEAYLQKASVDSIRAFSAFCLEERAALRAVYFPLVQQRAAAKWTQLKAAKIVLDKLVQSIRQTQQPIDHEINAAIVSVAEFLEAQTEPPIALAAHNKKVIAKFVYACDAQLKKVFRIQEVLTAKQKEFQHQIQHENAQKLNELDILSSDICQVVVARQINHRIVKALFDYESVASYDACDVYRYMTNEAGYRDDYDKRYAEIRVSLERFLQFIKNHAHTFVEVSTFDAAGLNTDQYMDDLKARFAVAVQTHAELNDEISEYPKGRFDWLFESADLTMLKRERDEAAHEIKVLTIMVCLDEHALVTDDVAGERLGDGRQLNAHLKDIEEKIRGLKFYHWGYTKKKALYQEVREKLVAQIEQLLLIGKIAEINKMPNELDREEQFKHLFCARTDRPASAYFVIFEKCKDAFPGLQDALSEFLAFVEKKKDLKTAWEKAKVLEVETTMGTSLIVVNLNELLKAKAATVEARERLSSMTGAAFFPSQIVCPQLEQHVGASAARRISPTSA